MKVNIYQTPSALRTRNVPEEVVKSPGIWWFSDGSFQEPLLQESSLVEISYAAEFWRHTLPTSPDPWSENLRRKATLSEPPFTVPPPVLALASKAPADSVIALSTWLVKIAMCRSPKSQTNEKAGLLQVSHFWWGVCGPPSWLVW